MTVFKGSYMKSLAAALLVVGLGAPLAQSAEGNVTVAFVDVERALSGTKDFKTAQADLEAFAKKQEASLKPQQEELKRQFDDYQAQATVMADEKRNERQIELQQLKNKLDRAVQDATEAVEARKAKMLNPILQKVKDAIMAVGKEKGLTIIMNKNSPGLIYMNDSFDITDVVIAKANE